MRCIYAQCLHILDGTIIVPSIPAGAVRVVRRVLRHVYTWLTCLVTAHTTKTGSSPCVRSHPLALVTTTLCLASETELEMVVIVRERIVGFKGDEGANSKQGSCCDDRTHSAYVTPLNRLSRAEIYGTRNRTDYDDKIRPRSRIKSDCRGLPLSGQSLRGESVRSDLLRHRRVQCN